MEIAIFSLAGLTLVAAVMWRERTRRVGGVPHCKRCDYLLHGIASDRCPECGRDLKPGGIVRGDRRRSPGFASAVFVLIAFDLILIGGHLSGLFSRVDWYSHMPNGWVLSDFSVTNPPSAAKAWPELRKRVAAGRLTPEQLADFTRREIDWQSCFPSGWSNVDPTADLVNKASWGSLPRSDADSFFKAQKVVVRCTARPVIGAGEPIVYSLWVNSASRVPFVMNWAGVWIDDQLIDPLTSSAGLRPWVGIGSTMTQVPSKPITPGKHRLRVVAKMYVQGSAAPSFFGNYQTLEAGQDVEILPGPSVRGTADDEWTPQLSAHVWHVSRLLNRGEIECWFKLPARKLAIAGHASFWMDGKEYPLCDVVIRANETGFIAVGPAPKSMPRSVDVVFRSDPTVALRTFDVREVAGGEIRLRNLEVHDGGDGVGQPVGGIISPAPTPRP